MWPASLAAQQATSVHVQCSASPPAGTLAIGPSLLYNAERGYGFRAPLAGASATECESDRPFVLDVALPEGDYDVTVTFGAAERASNTTVRAESRRLMLEAVGTRAGEVATRTFTVNVRTPAIPGGDSVRLKSREIGSATWDDRLSLEFTGEHPALREVCIAPARRPVTIFLAGNSTVVDQAAEPWAAWGQMIPRFFRPGAIVVANHAESGETLKAFIGERRLAKVLSTMKKGDYLFIEFAHNDQKPGSSYLDPFTTYKQHLKQFISEARSRGANPVLVTSMHRRRFDSTGVIINTLGDYPEAVRQTAAEERVPLIDLNAMSKQFYEALGPITSMKAFVHYPAGTYPNQTAELKDDTHFSNYGAYELARMVVEGIKTADARLARHLLPNLPRFDPAHPDDVDRFALPPSPVAWPATVAASPPVLETGAGPMPLEWIDQATGHRVMRLSRREGANTSFYFHNNPFLPSADDSGSTMVFSGTTAIGRQLFAVDLRTFAIRQLTERTGGVSGEIIAPRHREVVYQRRDSVFATHVDTRATRLVHVLPPELHGSISTLNADETLLAGVSAGQEARDILAKYPAKSEFFNRIFDAHVPHALFTVDLRTGVVRTVHQEKTWLGHVQFSPTDPALLMFCHEGPWHLLDRIWTIDVRDSTVRQIHHRTMEREIAGHEFWSPDGRTIWYDLQLPRGVTFFLQGADVTTGRTVRYQMSPDEWSIHFNVTADQRLFAGDGGDSTQVARAKNGRWLYLFRPEGERLLSERLVDMRRHNYRLEPNVHFTPDGKWVVFRGNFEGEAQVYAVEVVRAMQ